MIINPDPDPSIHISKSFIDVCIDTECCHNWRLVAAKELKAGEKLASHKIGSQLLCPNARTIKIFIQDDSLEKEIVIDRYAIPMDASCIPKLIELPWCFMNHSCEPNTYDQWQYCDNSKRVSSRLVIKQDIQQGEELTIDYCLEQYQYPTPFRCFCNSRLCRKNVFGFVALASSEKHQLLRSVSPFVQQRYAKAVNQFPTTEFS